MQCRNLANLFETLFRISPGKNQHTYAVNSQTTSAVFGSFLRFICDGKTKGNTTITILMSDDFSLCFATVQNSFN